MRANKKYLKVLTVVDTVSGNGQYIDANAWIGRRQNSRTRPIDWAIQDKPKAVDWTAWRRVIKRSIVNSTRNIHQPVGRWIGEEVIQIYRTGHGIWI